MGEDHDFFFICLHRPQKLTEKISTVSTSVLYLAMTKCRSKCQEREQTHVTYLCTYIYRNIRFK